MPNKITIDGDVATMELKRQDGSIILTVFDADDVEKVEAHPCRWYALYDHDVGGYYAMSTYRRSGKKTNVKLHRFLTGCPDGLVVDHIDHDTLNNRQANLRVVEHRINQQNRAGANKNSTTGIRGVSYSKAVSKWHGRVMLNGKQYGKYFETIHQAQEYVESLRKKLYA